MTRIFAENDYMLTNALHIDQSFDIIRRPVRLGGRDAAFYLIDGFVKDDLFEKLLEFFFALTADDPAFTGAEAFLSRAVPYCEAALETDMQKILTSILSGQTCLLIDGFSSAVLLDIRTYPQRDTAEPEKDKVLRGSHDGFVEAMVLNCALIRRRIRSPQLRMEYHAVGTLSQTDVALCYLDGSADPKLLAKIRDRLQNAKVGALTMNQESLSEILFRHKWYNPFPKFKYTERPDAAAAQILEGDIVILVDNAPACMILPTTIFDVLEETNDYYFPPLTGTYLRLTRYFVLLLMLLLTPVWLLLTENPGWLPPEFSFLLPAETPAVPIFWQLMILEVGIDGLKLATLSTPSMLTTSLSLIAGIVVGDFAVQSGWFSAETMLYMALVALGGYNQPSWELGYAMKFMRLGLLVLAAVFGLWGLVGGMVAILIILVSNKTFDGQCYLYPLIPFNWKHLKKKLFRPSIRRQ